MSILPKPERPIDLTPPPKDRPVDLSPLNPPAAPLNGSVSAADIRIDKAGSSITSEPYGQETVKHTVTIRVTSNNDDDASIAECLVLLPPTTRVLSSSPPAVLAPEQPALGPADQFVQSTPCHAYARFQMSTPIPVNGVVDLTLVVSVRQGWSKAPISAVVSSSVPDPDPSNNFFVFTPTP